MTSWFRPPIEQIPSWFGGNPQGVDPLLTQGGPQGVDSLLAQGGDPQEVNPPWLRGQTPGSRSPLGSGRGPLGSRSPLGSERGPPGSRYPLGSGKEPPGSRSPLGSGRGSLPCSFEHLSTCSFEDPSMGLIWGAISLLIRAPVNLLIWGPITSKSCDLYSFHTMHRGPLMRGPVPSFPSCHEVLIGSDRPHDFEMRGPGVHSQERTGPLMGADQSPHLLSILSLWLTQTDHMSGPGGPLLGEDPQFPHLLSILSLWLAKTDHMGGPLSWGDRSAHEVENSDVLNTSSYAYPLLTIAVNSNTIGRIDTNSAVYWLHKKRRLPLDTSTIIQNR